MLVKLYIDINQIYSFLLTFYSKLQQNLNHICLNIGNTTIAN